MLSKIQIESISKTINPIDIKEYIKTHYEEFKLYISEEETSDSMQTMSEYYNEECKSINMKGGIA